MKVLLAICLVLISIDLQAQSLSIFDIDTINFPTIKAKFIAIDKDGNQITNLAPIDFEIIENGIDRKVLNVSCPAPQPPQALSSVLVFDVSGSMIYGPPRIQSAKDAANAWVDGLPPGNSECALISFSDKSSILTDFTTNKQKLKNSINNLVPKGGTNYNLALIDLPCGGLQIATKGKHKRVLIFLTDGQPNFEPKTKEIIQFANSNNITIYAVTLDMPAPQSIKEMTLQTGGQYFENITTLKEAQETYQKLLLVAQGGDACEITWESGVLCVAEMKIVELKYLQNGTTATTSYQSPNASVAKLEFEPSSIKFIDPQVGVKVEQKVIVTARNTNFTVTNITSNNAGFEINPKSFTLNSGQSLELTVSYLPADSGYNFCRFEIENDNCPTKYYSSGGWKGIKPKIRTIKLIHPNGGEVFVAGSEKTITWEGVTPDEPVKLEYRIDDNQPWITIAESATGLSYTWRVPKTPSNKCLARVTAAAKTLQIYEEIQICNQIWMVRNLDVETYRNGDPIPEVTDPEQWANLKTGAWCYYNNDPANGAIYGKLYNWYAVNDPRGLAPKGWHIPTDVEWTELADCLGGESLAGGKLKSTGTIKGGDGLWKSPNEGATNESGFSALPGGYRNYYANYGYMSTNGLWWSSTEDNGSYAWLRSLFYLSTNLLSNDYSKVYGLSVRCLRD